MHLGLLVPRHSLTLKSETIQIKINTKQKTRTENLKPVNCKTDSVEQTDDLEKNKKTKKDEPVRTITKKTKCNLKNVNLPRHKFQHKITGNNSQQKVTVNTKQLDKLLGTTARKSQDKTTDIDIDALKRSLGVEGKTVHEAVLNYLRKAFKGNDRYLEAMDNFEKRRRKKELNKKYNDQRSKMERDYPLKAINKDFMSLANGVAESNSEEAKDAKVKAAFAALKNLLQKKHGQRDSVDDQYEDLKEKENKNCSPGNPNHMPPNSGDKSGQFTSKDKAGSWSLQWEKDRPDCE